jgi:protease IV
MAFLIYGIRSLLRFLLLPLRLIARTPDYVIFTLEGEYPDLPTPKEGFLRRRLMPKKTSLFELGERFEHVAGDRRVRGVLLHLTGLKLSIAQLQTVRGFIRKLQERGKRVITWASDYDMAAYYLAAATDEILLAHWGAIFQLGISRSYVYLGEALERIGLKADFVQISPYKSGADMLARSEMSEEARKMADWILDDTYASILQDIASDRGTDSESIKALVDGAPYIDQAAQEAGAIDGILNQEDLPEYLGNSGRPAKLVPYAGCRRKLLPRLLKRPGSYVGMIRVEGSIVDGRSSRPPMKPPLKLPLLLEERVGDLTVVQQMRRALTDKRAKALLLFVDSGGGSATSSEAMASALSRLAQKKPVVVFMSSVAASGGYYVAAPAGCIVAQPGTITGSIGVIAGKLVDTGMLEKLLIHREVLQRGENATFAGSHRRFTDEERERLLVMIKHNYSQFLDRVGSGRGMSAEAIDAIGGGRVWTGRQALENGLVDELGGLDVALAKARELAGLHPRARMREIPIPKAENLPIPSPLALLSYAKEGADQLQHARVLYLCPFIESD